MKIVNLSALVLFANGAMAADCLGWKTSGSMDKFLSAFWEAREKMCSNSDCALQQPCTTRASKTAGILQSKINVSIKRQNTAGKPGFKDCWDATENIIEQCSRNGYLDGIWEANGQLYQVNSHYS
ncbi:hypothetical protein SNK03_004306 [Fusarium graminearum]|uniref:Chromosome 2, complete genome n=1 Tax=Gibberella zeae (strain ATCC MYA-4620 / CBS 123657 / FGSC 9075 / NRRL 31084 / PH-1) TaxID=229533 RepID=A0A098DBM8_GIBZE|nr:hypothetical protein FGRA07_05107 [Fusarium graminearum]CEF76349.1 unnamed protein product [Fusarium graminearum]VTO87274.1 unnamed protein product [Fusarium graminearum]